MKIFLSTLLVVISTSVFSQHIPLGTAFEELDVSNIRPTILNGGDMFRERPTIPGVFNSGFEVPRGSGIHTMYAGALWIGGKDFQNTPYFAGQTYRHGMPPELGFWPGPIATSYNQTHTTFYDKIWKVSKNQILTHIANINQPGYVIPPDIATWPGNGNVANGEASKLAPFIDLNNNGVYEPTLGDYPDIKGDQALYLILNDSKGIKNPLSPAIGAEVHAMYYGFDSPQNQPINHTLFSEFRIINRGNINFQDFYAGIWTDLDIGNFSDDFIGCDTTTNRYFGYNADNFDEDSVIHQLQLPPFTQINYVNSYGLNPPVQSVMFLDNKMTHFMYYNNSSNRVNGDPFFAADYYNYLRGIWKNNTPLTYGGDGTNPANPPATHMFAGDPVTATGWSERNNLAASGANVPGDRRGVGSIGPFTLNAGQELKFTVAYNYSRGTSNLNSVTQSKADAIAVQNFFRSQILATPKPVTPKTELVLFPNPATDKLTVQLPVSFTNKAVTVQVSDYTGRTVLQTTSRQTGSNLYLNISSLSKGIYQVKVTSDNQVRTARLAKL